MNQLEPLLNIGNLRTCSDTRVCYPSSLLIFFLYFIIFHRFYPHANCLFQRAICTILTKVAAEDASALARLEFTKLTKRKKCLQCLKEETMHPPRGPPNGYFLYIDGTSRSMVRRLESSFNRQRECLDCSCVEV